MPGKTETGSLAEIGERECRSALLRGPQAYLEFRQEREIVKKICFVFGFMR